MNTPEIEECKQVVGLRLTELRKNANKPRDIVADCTDIAIFSLQQYENGNTLPNAYALKNLAEYYGVTIDYITGLTNDPKTHQFKTEYQKPKVYQRQANHDFEVMFSGWYSGKVPKKYVCEEG